MRPLYLIMFFCAWIATGQSQQLPKGQYFEGSFHIGRIYKHTPKIVIPFNEIRPTLGVELSWEHNPYGKKYWHQIAKFPRLGMALSFQDFGDPRLGWGLGVIPHFTGRIFKIGPVEMFARIGLGLGYVSKFWDSYSNPQNNIIGSHLNNNTGIRFGFGIKALRQFEFRPSFSFTHYSNGASQFPNLGINVMSFHLGVLYKNNPLLPEDYLRSKTEDLMPRHKRLFVHISEGGGLKEIGRTLRGPKYAVLLTSVDVGLFLARNNRLKLGFTHEYNPSDLAFFLHNGSYSLQMARKEANRYLFYVEDEILMGHLGLVGQIGYYFNNAVTKFPFTRIGMRYYPLDPLKSRWAPYIGLHLKSHAINAEYFDVRIGLVLRT